MRAQRQKMDVGDWVLICLSVNAGFFSIMSSLTFVPNLMFQIEICTQVPTDMLAPNITLSLVIFSISSSSC